MKGILMAGVLISAFSTPAFTQCTDADAQQLEAFDRAWSEATRTGDRGALQGIVADNFAGITPTGLTSKAEPDVAQRTDTQEERGRRDIVRGFDDGRQVVWAQGPIDLVHGGAGPRGGGTAHSRRGPTSLTQSG